MSEPLTPSARDGARTARRRRARRIRLELTAIACDALRPVRTRAPRRALCAWSVAAVGFAAACSPVAAPPRALHHRLTRPANPDGVFLNEELVFYFSDEVDRSSVTRDSVRIVAADGARARGVLSVDDASVRFTPEPVLAADLGDGGYRPDTQYDVEILGFPNPDGLRGGRGEPLASTYRWSFRTVRRTQPRSALIFDDRMQDQRPGLALFPTPRGGPDAPALVGPRDSIYLACNKPLDPSSIRDEDFDLRAAARSGASVQVRARLVENHAQPTTAARLPAARSSAPVESWERQPRAALIELTPKEAMAAGEYLLALRSSRDGELAGPVDFSGRPALLSARSSLSYPTVYSVRVTETIVDSGRGVLHEAFLDTRLRSPVAVPGYDGTAHWSDSGRVEVRYPAAAGDGTHGELELAGEDLRSDIHATRVHVAEGAKAVLSPAEGLVVVRCQGRMSIQGELVRSAPSVPRLGVESGGTLSEWLARVDSENRTWTVLVAGGDLVIEGSVRVTTPLLLCAGGVIRVSGTVTAATEQLWLLGEGGGISDPSERRKATWLSIDAPLTNPLKVPLRLAVLSGPIPPQGDVVRWLAEEVRGSGLGRDARGGRWSVRYVQELTATAIADERLVPVESPRLFDQPGSLQLLITLEVPAADASAKDPVPAWDPPFVDYVRLLWE